MRTPDVDCDPPDDGDDLAYEELTEWLMRLSEPAFARVWDNEADAIYDTL